MPFTSISSACICGPLVVPVKIEVDLQPGLPQFTIVGMPDQRIAEAKQRVRAAIKNSGLQFPLGRITVNLSPADVPKQGTGFDLGIALGILQVTGKVKPLSEHVWVFGGLSLTGEIQPIRFMNALLIEAKLRGIRGCIVPQAAHLEQVEADGCQVCRSHWLKDLTGERTLNFKAVPKRKIKTENKQSFLIDEVLGQVQAKRVLQIALAGRHNILISGPPGSGKTMLAQAAGDLLPNLNDDDWHEVVKLFGIAEVKPPSYKRPPFRAPHSAIARSQLIGGNRGKPGEISLASKGILFLDEFPEFSREVRESLRQPIEEGEIRINFGGKAYSYPADIQFIAAQNACPCGLLGVVGESCRCSPQDHLRYSRALSQPMLDRIELFCSVPQVKIEDWQIKDVVVSGAQIQESILRVGDLQTDYFGKSLSLRQLSPSQVRHDLKIGVLGKAFLTKIGEQFYCSARTLNNLIRVAFTIANLEGKTEIELEHIQEAAMYRYRPYKV